MGQKGYHETQEAKQTRLEWYETLRAQVQDVVANPALYGAEVDLDMDGLKGVVTRSGVNIVNDTAGSTLLYEEEKPQEMVTQTLALYGEDVNITVERENDDGHSSKTIPVSEHVAFIANFIKTMQLVEPI